MTTLVESLRRLAARSDLSRYTIGRDERDGHVITYTLHADGHAEVVHNHMIYDDLTVVYHVPRDMVDLETTSHRGFGWAVTGWTVADIPTSPR